MKKDQLKSVRMSGKVVQYIEGYRGENFSESLENMVLDMMERHDDLVRDWDMLQAQIGDKRHEMRQIQQKVQRLREVDRRLSALVSALEDLLSVE